MRTVQLLRHDTIVLLNCPKKAEVKAVDGQSDLRILLMEPKSIVELHTLGLLLMNSWDTKIYFLATTIICSLSTLN